MRRLGMAGKGGFATEMLQPKASWIARRANKKSKSFILRDFS
jgi:hypothetical protein